MAATSELKHEWRQFKHDPPGERFENHRCRMKSRPTWLMATRLVLGVALLGAGLAMLVLPGPGLLGIVFGLGLLAGMSRKLAGVMDRAEPPVRQTFARGAAWWRQRGRSTHVLLIVVASAGVAVAGYLTWRALAG